jgi:hypothetical protein
MNQLDAIYGSGLNCNKSFSSTAIVLDVADDLSLDMFCVELSATLSPNLFNITLCLYTIIEILHAKEIIRPIIKTYLLSKCVHIAINFATLFTLATS